MDVKRKMATSENRELTKDMQLLMRGQALKRTQFETASKELITLKGIQSTSQFEETAMHCYQDGCASVD